MSRACAFRAVRFSQGVWCPALTTADDMEALRLAAVTAAAVMLEVSEELPASPETFPDPKATSPIEASTMGMAAAALVPEAALASGMNWKRRPAMAATLWAGIVTLSSRARKLESLREAHQLGHPDWQQLDMLQPRLLCVTHLQCSHAHALDQLCT